MTLFLFKTPHDVLGMCPYYILMSSFDYRLIDIIRNSLADHIKYIV